MCAFEAKDIEKTTIKYLNELVIYTLNFKTFCTLNQLLRRTSMQSH